MWYKIHRDVPANTPAASPDKQTLDITRGDVKAWLILCPVECADLMKYKILYHGVQLFPFTRDEWGDALIAPVPLEENIRIDVSPYVLHILAYNDDDSFPHEYNIYANVLREKPVTSPTSTFDLRGAWERLFGGGM